MVRTNAGGCWARCLLAGLAVVTALPLAARPAEAAGPGDQSITLAISSSTVSSGSRVTLRGKLIQKEAKVPAVGKTVKLEYRPSGAKSWKTAATIRTTASGAFQAKFRLLRNTEFRARVPGSKASSAVIQGTARQTIQVTAVTSGLVWQRLGMLTVKGKASQGLARRTLLLQLKDAKSGAWRTVGKARVTSAGRFVIQGRDVAGTTQVSATRVKAAGAPSPSIPAVSSRARGLRTPKPVARPIPVLIAHRGGAAVYPEQSLQGFQAAARSGFIMEADVRSLKDGTLVPLHDRTVNRTMIGISGPVNKISKARWKKAKIRDPGQGKAVKAPTWDQLLDTVGGKGILNAELKVQGPAVRKLIASIKTRKLEGTVIVSSFSLRTAREAAKAGLHAQLNLGSKDRPDPATLKHAGVEVVAVATRTPATYVRKLERAGLVVWAYTVNSKKSRDAQVDRKVAGIISDDPWTLAALENEKPLTTTATASPEVLPPVTAVTPPVKPSTPPAAPTTDVVVGLARPPAFAEASAG